MASQRQNISLCQGFHFATPEVKNNECLENRAFQEQDWTAFEVNTNRKRLHWWRYSVILSVPPDPGVADAK